MRRRSQVLLLALVQVIQLLLGTVASASGVPVEALVIAMQSRGPYCRVRAALPILLVLKRGALRLGNVGAELRDYVPLVHAGLLLLNIPLILLDHLARCLYIAGPRCNLRGLLQAVSH